MSLISFGFGANITTPPLTPSDPELVEIDPVNEVESVEFVSIPVEPLPNINIPESVEFS
jgi:hypothetical protein